MTKLTALEIANNLETANNQSELPWSALFEAVSMLRYQHAEIGRLTKQSVAYATLVKSQEAQLSILRTQAISNGSEAMTMRDYFASAAMQVILSYRLHHPITDEQIANGAYEIADAMIAERAKR